MGFCGTKLDKLANKEGKGKEYRRNKHFHMRPLEKLQNLRQKQKSFRFGILEKQQSFLDEQNKDCPGKRGDTQLHVAARTGNVVHAERILSQCDPISLRELVSAQNQDGETGLYVAAENGHVGAVCEILKASDIQSASLKANNSYDSFHIAAKHGHLGNPLISFL